MSELIINKISKKKNRNIPEDKDRCKGLKKDGTRCTRQYTDKNVFLCKSHKRINENNSNTTEIKEKKKRGRKPKIIPDPKLNDSDYLPVVPCLIDGIIYFIDFQNNVYTYDTENPKFIGIKTIYGIQKIEYPIEK